MSTDEQAPPRSGTIYIHSISPDGGDGMCYALAEDGHVLASHWCSTEDWANYDLHLRGHHFEAYAKHYPEGYEMEFVPHDQVDVHPGLAKAREWNAILADAFDRHG